MDAKWHNAFEGNRTDTPTLHVDCRLRRDGSVSLSVHNASRRDNGTPSRAGVEPIMNASERAPQVNAPLGGFPYHPFACSEQSRAERRHLTFCVRGASSERAPLGGFPYHPFAFFGARVEWPKAKPRRAARGRGWARRSRAMVPEDMPARPRPLRLNVQ
jgi:hypothetical protein